MDNSPAQFNEANTLNVTAAAEILGVSPSTLRNLEKEGRIISQRQPNGYREFTHGDILKLKTELAAEKIEQVKQKQIKKIISSQAVSTNSNSNEPEVKQADFQEPVEIVSTKTNAKPFNFNFGLRNYAKMAFTVLVLLVVASGFDSHKQQTENGNNLAAVLAAQSNAVNYLINFNTPATFHQNTIVDSTITVNKLTTLLGGVDTKGAAANLGETNVTNVTFNGSATMNKLGAIDATTKTTLEKSLGINGDVTGTSLNNVKIKSGIINQTYLAKTITYNGTLDLTGTWNVNGKKVTSTGAELNYLTGTQVVNGGILFGDGTKITQSPQAFFWDSTNNYLGIGNSAPEAALSVGSANGFQVNNNGNITKANNVPYSWPSSQASASNQTLLNDGSGNLFWGDLGLVNIADNSLDFNKFKDNMTLDASTDINLNGFNLSTSGTGNVYFNHNGVVTVAGNFGVGTTNPSTKLYVNGDTTLSGNVTVTSGKDINVNGENLGAVQLGNRQYTQQNYVTSGQSLTGSINALDTSLYALSSGHAGLWQSGTQLIFPSNATNVAITDSGKLGIGTTNPQVALDVNGSLNASGTVTLSGLTPNKFVVTTTGGQLTILDKVDLTAQVSGILPVANGGSGANTFTTNGVLYGQGTSPINATAAPTLGQILVGGTSGIPTFVTMSGDATINESGVLSSNVTYSNGLTRTGTAVKLGGALTGSTRLYDNNYDYLYLNNSNGYVGVGTTSPAQKLDVNGSVNIANGSDLYLQGEALRGTALGNRTYTNQYYVTNGQSFTASMNALDTKVHDIIGGSAGLWLDTGSYIYPTTASSVVVTNDNKLGLGTTNPQYALDVNGAINFTNSLRVNGQSGTIGQLLVSSGAGTAPTWQNVTGIIATSGWSLFGNSSVDPSQQYLGTADNNPLVIRTNNNEAARFDTSGNLVLTAGKNIQTDKVRARDTTGLALQDAGGNGIFIKNGGNVGIGTTNPGTSLDVTGAGRFAGLSAVSTSAVPADGSLYSTYLYTDHIDAYTVGGGVLFINSGDTTFTGNVGIGTTLPTNKLEVVGNFKDTGTVTFSGLAQNSIVTTTTGGQLTTQTAIDAGTQISGILPVQYGGTGNSSVTTNQMLYGNGTGALNTTNTPASGQVLMSNGSGVPTFTTITGDVTINSSGVATVNATPLTFSNGITKTGNAITLGGIITGDTRLYDSSSHEFMFLQSATGNVGIGTTAPASVLNIVGTSEQLRLAYDAADYTSFVVDANGGLTIANNGTNVASFNQSQATINVPLNIASPGDVSIANDLHFTNLTSSYITSDSNLYIQAGTPSEAQNLYLTTAGSGQVVADSNLEVTGNLDVNVGKLFVNGTTGLVGIGTTAPLNALDVNGGLVVGTAYAGVSTAPSNGLLVSGNVGIGTTNPDSVLSVHSSGGSTYPFDVTQSTNSTKLFSIYQTAGGSSQILGYDSTGGVGVTLSASGVSYLVGGNVGIGTTSPLNKLDINGGEVIGSYAGVSTAPSNGLLVSGNVGIGTTNPTNKLTVNGSIEINGANPLTYYNDGVRNATFGISTTAGQITTGSQIGDFNIRSAQGNINFGVNSIQTVIQGATGNVGIGTTNPLNKLDVNGGEVIGTYAGVNTAPSNGLLVSGNVGIGTTNPGSYNLNVNGSINATSYYMGGTQITSSAAQLNYLNGTTVTSGGVMFADGSKITQDAGNFFWNSTTHSLGIGTTAPLNKLDINGGEVIGSYAGVNTAPTNGLLVSGNVGIGTTNPASQLNVLGTSEQLRLAYDAADYTSFVIDSTGALNLSNNGNSVASFGQNQINAYVPVNFGAAGDVSVAYDLQFTNQTASSIKTNAPLTIDVGESFENNDLTLRTYGVGNLVADLGTGGAFIPSQDNTFNIGSTTNRWAAVHTGNAGVVVHNDATNTNYLSMAFSGANALISTDAATPLWLTSGTNPGIFVTTAGLVGVGTTSPYEKLQVTGNLRLSKTNSIAWSDSASSDLNDAIRVDDNPTWFSGSNNIMTFRSYGGPFVFRDSNLSANLVTILTSGNVGIGTTNPAYRLQVEASTANLLRLKNTTGTAGSNVILNFDDTAENGNYTGGIGLYGGTTPRFGLNLNGTETITSLFNGNVGIGTTNPGGHLEINHTASATNDFGLVITSNANGQSGTTQIYLAKKTNSPAYGIYLASTPYAADIAKASATLNIATVTANDIIFSPNNTEAMRILSSGNVGIGTTNPGSALDVQSLADGLTASTLRLTNTGSSAQSMASLEFYRNTTALKVARIRANGTGTNIGDLYLEPSNGANYTTAMFLQSGGNVGIGTTNPQNKLDVNGGLVVGSYAGVNTAPSNGLLVSGNVGIGTTNPQAKLDLVDASTTTGNVANIYGSALTTGNILALKSDTNRNEVTVSKSDMTLGGQKDLTTLSNINNVFIYDTAKDSDGGAWRKSEKAKASSWYNETLNTATRGATREFPEKAIIVVRTSSTGGMYIYDAKDNSLWMRFDGTSFSWGNSPQKAVFAKNGIVYNTISNGLFEINFTKDNIKYYGSGGSDISANNIGNRSTVQSAWGMPLSWGSLVNGTVNDVYSTVINGKTYTAVATNAGVSVINETDQVVYSYSDNTSDQYNAVWLTSNGDLYAANYTQAQVERWNKVISISSRINGTPDQVWDETTTPALWTSAPTMTTSPDQLVVKEGASVVDGTSPAIYFTHGGGLTVINTKAGDETNGSVKYYTSNYITEDLAGDIRGAYAFNGTSGNTIANSTDISDTAISGNTLTSSNANGTGLAYATGVRGTGITFDGTDDYLKQKVYTTQQGTLGYLTTPARFQDQSQNFSTYQTNVGNAAYMIVITNNDATVSWGYMGAASTVTNANDTIAVYTDKALSSAGWNGQDPTAKTPSSYEVRKTNFQITGAVTVGAWVKQTTWATNKYLINKYSGTNATSSVLLHTGITVKRPVFYVMSGSTSYSAVASSDVLTDGQWAYIVGVYVPSTSVSLYVNGVLVNQNTTSIPASINDVNTAMVMGARSDGSIAFLGGSMDEPFVTASALSAAQIKHMYQVGAAALNQHTASRVTGISTADNYQQLQGGVTTANAVAVDDANRYIYVGTNDASANTGALTVIGANSDSVVDLYSSSNTTKVDDSNTQFDANDIVSVSVAGTPVAPYNSGSTTTGNAGNLIIAGTNDTTTKFWAESNSYSLYSTLAQLNDPTLTKNNIQVNNTFTVYNNNVASATSGEVTPTAVFQIDQLGNITSQSAANSTTAAQFKNASGTNLLTMDTTNMKVGIGSSSVAAGMLQVNESSNASNPNALVVAMDSTTNLGTNPSLETNATTWSNLNSGTITQDSTYAMFGTYAAKVVAGTNAYGGTTYYSSGSPLTVTPNTTYTVSSYIYRTSSVVIAQSVRSPVGGDHSLGTVVTTKTNQWERLVSTFTTEATQTSLYIDFIKNNDTTAATFYVDGVQIEQKDHATPYADGSLGLGYAWTGTANASTSTRSADSLFTDQLTTINNNLNVAKTAYFAGSVGLGTTSPLNKLDVNGGEVIGAYAGVNTAPSNGLLVSGTVGIGTTNPSSSMALDVNGKVHIGDLTQAGGGSTLLSSNGILTTVSSSRRYKTDIQDWNINLNSILALQPVTFDWGANTLTPGMHDVGMIAEDTYSQIPQLATYEADGTTIRGIRYDMLGVVAISGIKQQQALIDALTAQTNDNSTALTNDINNVNQSLSTTTVSIDAISGDITGMQSDITTMQQQIADLQKAQLALESSSSAGTATANYASADDLASVKQDVANIKALLAGITNETSESSETSETSQSSGSTTTVSTGSLLTQMLDIFNQFKDFVASLGLSSAKDANGNDVLAISKDVNIAGNTTLNGTTITDKLDIGTIVIDPMETSINVLGASCYTPATGIKDADVCQSQTVYIQKNLAGNVDIFNGTVVIEPDGKFTVNGTVKAQKYEVETAGVNPSAGKITIKAGDTTIEVETSSVTDSSMILVTPDQPVAIGSKKTGDGKFEITLKDAQSNDVNVSWWIIN